MVEELAHDTASLSATEKKKQLTVACTEPCVTDHTQKASGRLRQDLAQAARIVVKVGI